MKSRWKSTSKKLPKDGEEVIFIAVVPFTTRGDALEKQCIGKWVASTRRFYVTMGYYYELAVVTHWANLLKFPPKEK